MNPPKSINVVGRRWFDKRWGNTYNTVTLWIDDKEINLPLKYGYGDYYLQRADEYLSTNAIFDSGTSHLSRACREAGINFHYAAIDVTRKRDL